MVVYVGMGIVHRVVCWLKVCAWIVGSQILLVIEQVFL